MLLCILACVIWQVYFNKTLHKMLQVNSAIFRSELYFICQFSPHFTNTVVILWPSNPMDHRNDCNHGLSLQLTMPKDTLLFLCFKQATILSPKHIKVAKLGIIFVVCAYQCFARLHSKLCLLPYVTDMHYLWNVCIITDYLYSDILWAFLIWKSVWSSTRNRRNSNT